MLNNISTGDWIQIIFALITAIGVIIALIVGKNQLKFINRQLKLNFFADYTKRYQEIILNFPENINERHFRIEKLKKKERDRTLRYMRAYFDLCSEEFYLNINKHIDNYVWKIWESGIRFALTKRAFQDAWKIIMADTIYDKEFTSWVTMQINLSQSHSSLLK